MKSLTEEKKEENPLSKTKAKFFSDMIKKQCTVEKSNHCFFEMFNDNEYYIRLFIPDTIIFYNGCIINWFYTGPEGYLMKKNIDAK